MTLKDEITKTKEGSRAWHQERLILEVSEIIHEIMDRHKVNRWKFIESLGLSIDQFVQAMNGNPSMTLRTVADMLALLGYQLEVSVKQIEPPDPLALPAGNSASPVPS